MATIAVQRRDEDRGFIFDNVAKFYISLFAVWTSIILLAVLYLLLNRKAQCVRVRNLPLSLGATACLHLFWSASMFAYSMHTSYPCAAEYWVMNIFLPFSIALFQANNMVLLSVSSKQEEMLRARHSSPAIKTGARPPLVRRLWLRWTNMSLLKRTQLGIAVGMVIQILLSSSIFLASRKFHSFGTLGHPVSQKECRKGVEWVISIIWQFTWAWLFAPYILWKIRKIRDVHHWRLQTTLCVVSALPGTPIWLVSLYSSSTAWAAVNQYFMPGCWFVPGMMVMEACTIFFPCYELATSRPQRNYIARGLRALRNRSQAVEINSTAGTDRSQTSVASNSNSSSSEARFSKRAFDKLLAEDSRPLFHFAASKEFSGENILFLDAVRDWKASWTALSNRLGKGYNWNTDPNGYRLHYFKRAVGIYVTCIDLDTAEFPINIESQIYADLHSMFSQAGRQISFDQYEGSVFSFSFTPPAIEPSDDENLTGSYNSNSMSYSMEQLMVGRLPTPATENDEDPEVVSPPSSPTSKEYLSQKTSLAFVGPPRVVSGGHDSDCMPPREFGIHTFDAADKSIRSLVYSSTWPKFVGLLGERTMQ